MSSELRPYSKPINFKIDDGKIYAEGEIYGPSEFLNLKIDGFSVYFVVDSGENNFLAFKDSSLNDIDLHVTNGPFASNALFAEVAYLKDHYRSRYGDTVITEPYGEKIFILNKMDKILELSRDRVQLIREAPPSYYTLLEYFTIYQRSLPIEHLERLAEALEELPDNLRNTELGRELYYDLHATITNNRANSIGNPVLNFSVLDNQGNVISNSDYAGTPYIIAFSATWCVPCQVYQKKLKEIYKRYQAAGLEIIYFNLDDNVERWHEHIKKNELTWINVSERVEMHKSQIATLFHVSTIPNYILIDQKGEIIYNDKLMNDPQFDQLEDFMR